ncbi:MAG: hypothetical protein SPG03_06985 [Veillonella caviae]|uniref:hypothetical protein n=1 Tax=Veillonella caviae TaxID=248316 RepID=UPI002A91B1A5|nr:hypothetical protein [Veillonella caviae]MDY5482111.1 hypothetical protein [Veillonella caviae]
MFKVKKKKENFFKGIFLLGILLLLDISFLYVLVAQNSYVKSNIQLIAAILFFNAVGLYVISVLYRYTKTHRYKDILVLIDKYKNESKPNGIKRLLKLFFAVSLIAWGTMVETDIVIKILVVLLGVYRLWRVW